MTEQEWLTCTDPNPMLEFLRGKASDRKLRLFVCAATRTAGTIRGRPWFQQAMGVAERFADGIATDAQLQFADRLGFQPLGPLRSQECDVWEIALKALYPHASLRTVQPVDPASFQALWEQERFARCQLLHDFFGNPFRPFTINRRWLTPTVTSLATAAYEERALPSGELDPARLSVLADALEEVGCDNFDILNHLRGPGPHVRGCWVIDLLTGRS